MLVGLAGLADQRELVLFALGQAVGGVALERERERGDDGPFAPSAPRWMWAIPTSPGSKLGSMPVAVMT